MPLLRLASAGRGAHYGPLRGVIESSLRLAYRGDWPASLWARFPASCRDDCLGRVRLGDTNSLGEQGLCVGFVPVKREGRSAFIVTLQLHFRHVGDDDAPGEQGCDKSEYGQADGGC